jgi:EmrB/QacA subfamily drug resistance transporter
VGPSVYLGMNAPGPDPRRFKALALLCTATFMVILDAQIVILALPSIEAELRFSPGGVQWVLSAYLLSFGGLLLLGGRIADLLGRRRVFMVGTALFLCASLMCGFAWSGWVLVAARVVQGVSAAIMAPSALSILMGTFAEGSERNKALGIWSGVGGTGATAALLIGGPLADGPGWEWIFFLNVPVAMGLLVLSPVLLGESREPGRRRFDPAGAVTITAGMVLLVYAVVEAPEAGWRSGQTIGLLTGSVALLTLFAGIEKRSAEPLVPFRIFRSRVLVGGNLVMFVLGMLAFGMSLVLSLYAQQVLGLSPLLFGLGTAVMTVTAVVGSMVGQAAVTRTGLRPVAAAGMVLLGAGCLLLTQVSVTGSYIGDILAGLLIFGPGLGACFVAASIAALTGVADHESGLASGINTATFQIGGALGVAITTTVAVSYTVGSEPLAALTEGYRAGFTACAVIATIGLLVALVLLRRPQRGPTHLTDTPASAQL